MITLDAYKEDGFILTWPYSPDPNVRAAIINSVKKTAGFSFSKPMSGWVSAGPEVILDLDRYELWPYITQVTPKAAERVSAFRTRLELILEAKHAEHAGQYGYQQSGATALAFQERGLLADDMGLGKSKQALDAANMLDFGEGYEPYILILAPKTLTYNWKNEIEKWYPEWNVVLWGDTATKRDEAWQALKRHKQDTKFVFIANYEKTILKDWPDRQWDIIILDECHKLKNTNTKTHKAVKKIGSDFVWGLSGTPMEIRVEELYGVMSILRPAVFGSWLRFREQHVMMDAWGNVIGPRNQELLKERIAPWMTRRKKSDVLKQLPEKLYNTLYIDMSAEERKEYKRIKDEFLAWLTDNDRSSTEANALTKLLRLQQFTCSPILLDPDDGLTGPKFEELADIVKEWDGKIMVFTRFSQMAWHLLDWLGLSSSALIAGEVSAEDRVGRVAAFNEGKLGKVLVSTDAGAYGLNATGANLIVHYDQLWNPGKMRQREDRLHRIGQTDTVNVLNLVMQGTVDEGMLKVLEKRQALFEDVIDGAEEASIMKIGSGGLRKIIEGKI